MDTPSPEDKEEENLPLKWHREMMEGRASKRLHEKLDDYADQREKDVVILGREAYCSFACKLIHREMGMGEPYGVIATDGGITHFFLKVGEKGLDMGGYSTFEELLAMFDDAEKVAPVKWRDVSNAIDELGFSGESDEGEIIAERFENHIKEHREEWLRASQGEKSQGPISN